MKIAIDPARAAVLHSNLASIRSRIRSTLSQTSNPTRPVRLVAVSKLKPASDILALHQQATSTTPTTTTPQVHFGENYVQELLEKSRVLPKSIRWHFIGGLQSNKCAMLARDVDSLWAVESVDSEKKAGLLDKGRGERNQRLGLGSKPDGGKDKEEEEEDSRKLRIFIQVNTSGEESKAGLAPDSPELVALARYVLSDVTCSHLHLQGLMTIGAIARSKATTPETENEDFITLRDARDRLVAQLRADAGEDIKEKDKDVVVLDLSMGMSEDFEGAVRLGSDEVRVGSTIFGERPAKKDAKVIP